MRTTLPASIFLAALAPLAATQTTWNVPGDAATIEGAMLIAFPGDTVVVAPGSWDAPGDAYKEGVSLVSSHGPQVTELVPKAPDARHLVIDGGPPALIEGFTLRNAQPAVDALEGHGGSIHVTSADHVIRDCWFLDNSAADRPQATSGSSGASGGTGDPGQNGGHGSSGQAGCEGGAIFVDGGVLRVEACSFYGNRAGHGAAGGHGGKGGNGGPDGVFTAGPGEGGDGGDGGDGGRGGAGGAIATRQSATVDILNTVFLENSTGSGGVGGKGGHGGNSGDPGGLPILADGGHGGDGGDGGGSGLGGALACTDTSFAAASTFTVRGCVFSANDACCPGLGGGGGQGGSGSPTGVDGSTGFGGSSGYGGVLYDAAPNCFDTLQSSILWGNAGGINDAYALSGTLTLSHCSTDAGHAGTGNISGDPQFVIQSLSEPWKNLGVGAGSPCIDAGDNTGFPVEVYTDLLGNLRFRDDPFAPDTGVPGGSGGSARVDIGAHEHDAASPYMTTDTMEISALNGGTATFDLDAGPFHAAKIYLVLGSLSGTYPGTPSGFGSAEWPLVFDLYFNYLAAHPGSPPMAASLGILDAAGGAQVDFVLPPFIASSLAGSSAHHAFAVVETSPFLQIPFVSNPVPLVFTP